MLLITLLILFSLYIHYELKSLRKKVYLETLELVNGPINKIEVEKLTFNNCPFKVTKGLLEVLGVDLMKQIAKIKGGNYPLIGSISCVVFYPTYRAYKIENASKLSENAATHLLTYIINKEES